MTGGVSQEREVEVEGGLVERSCNAAVTSLRLAPALVNSKAFGSDAQVFRLLCLRWIEVSGQSLRQSALLSFSAPISGRGERAFYSLTSSCLPDSSLRSPRCCSHLVGLGR